MLAPVSKLLSIAAVGNASIFDFLFKVALGRFGFPEFVVGVLQRLPFPEMDEVVADKLGRLARRAWSLKRSLDTKTETSHAFVLPALLQIDGERLSSGAEAWGDRVRTIETEIANIQREIDDLCFDLYGIDEEDRQTITQGLGTGSSEQDEEEAENGDGENDQDLADPISLTAELISWSAGVAFGRFDFRLATGERDYAEEPEPFDPLPICSPGMLAGDDGLPLTRPPDGYPIPFPASGSLVEDGGHPSDFTTALRRVFDIVFGDAADGLWQEAASVLDPKTTDMRKWLSKGFFDYHLKTYSKSSRKAPILWPIGTRSGSYLVWLYAHRVTSDTLFQILNDLVAPKVMLEEQQLTRLRQDAGPDPTASQRKIIDKQEGFLAELRELQEAITAVAPLWAPDLNDGIVIVLAPLWELFAHHRTWSSELKKHWGKLVNGEYDWAQLAMHLWPERVIPKCAEDRSLAIAHGLEEVFWHQGDTNDDKWHPREHPTTPIEELVIKRRNPAVTAALNHLANA